MDAVRFLTGQTSTQDDILVYDEEILYSLSQRNQNAYAAASLVCQSLAARFAAQPEIESVGALGLTWGDRAQRMRERAIDLRGQIALAGVSPYAGGISIADQQADRQDSDVVQMPFRIGMDDNPRSVRQASPSTGTLPPP